MKLGVEVNCLLTSVQVCLWVQKMLNEEVIIGVLYILIGKIMWEGFKCGIYTAVYVLCDKTCKIFKKYLYLLNILEKCLY